MPARNANRGRGGGQGRDGNRQSGAGARQGSSGAASASSRGGSTGGSSARSGGASANRAATSATQSSRATGRSGGGGARAGGGSSSGVRGGTTPGTGARSAAGGETAAGRRSAIAGERAGQTGQFGATASPGGSTGLAGGDLFSGGISATESSAGTPGRRPAPSGVDAALFGGGLSTPASDRSAERERPRGPENADRDAIDSAGAGSDVGGPQASGVAGRGRSPGLSTWFAGAENPLAMMRRMQDDLDRVFRAFGVPRLGAAFTPPRELEEFVARSPGGTPSGQWSPQIEVFERDGNLVVHADLPAVRREDVAVELENDVLTIRGERRQQSQEAEGGYRRTERSYGTFLRQVPLPEGVDPADIEATYQDGVLEVVVPTPRDEQRSRRRIEIR